MNTLKPLLIVAVLAGVGYGVYIRLNDGNSAPPPAVAEGWDSAPAVQLPDQATASPWGSPGVTAPGPAGPFGQSPAAAAPPLAGGNAAPPFNPPSPAAAPAEQAPPFDQAAGGEAPPYANTNAPPAAESVAGSPSNPFQPPAANPNDNAPPAGAGETPPTGASEGPPLSDPYEDSNDVNVPDRYRTSPSDGGPPADSAPPADSTPPADDPQQSPPAGDPSSSSAPGPPAEFTAALDSVKHELEGGQMASALRQLTQLYGNPQLPPAEQQELVQLLDQVAGSVVYSTQHLLEPPYEVQPGERLEDIGEKYGVPWQLLAKINGIDDPAAMQPGERLKVVRGPFQAVISLEKRELVLLTADGSYAGRFNIGIGGEHPPQEGTFPVSEKVVNPVYYGRDRAISAEDADNPLGERWIGLGNKLGIHGTNNPENIGRTGLPGSISLNQRDVEDVYDILSLGSRVTIRR